MNGLWHRSEPPHVGSYNFQTRSYTSRFNRKHRLVGHLFSGRYKALPVDSPVGREEFAARLEARRRSEPDEELDDLPAAGWCLGNEPFRQELLRQMTGLPEHNYGGPEWRETAEQKALRILAEELERCDWQPEELPRQPKGDLHKITIARRLRAETTMTWAWIAHHLSMGAPGSVANRLRSSRNSPQ